MQRLSAATMKGRMRVENAATRTAAVTADGYAVLFPCLPLHAVTIPWCTGLGSVQLRSAAGRHEPKTSSSLAPAPHPSHTGLQRSHAVQSRRHYTGDVCSPASGASQAAQQQGMLMMTVPAWLRQGADHGMTLARASSIAEQSDVAMSAQERDAIIKRLRRELAQRGMTERTVSQHMGPDQQHAARRTAVQLQAEIRAAVNKGYCAEALKLFDPGLLLEMNSYMAASICDEVLKACSRLADPDLALQLVHAMRCLGVPRGFKAHGHVVGALCAACKHEEALDYLDSDVPAESQHTFMYNTILSSAAYHRQSAVVPRCLETMSAKGMPRTAHTWALVFNLQECCKMEENACGRLITLQGQAGDAAAIHKTWAQVDEDMQGSAPVRAALASALAACGRAAEAANALAEALKLHASLLTGGSQAGQQGRGPPMASGDEERVDPSPSSRQESHSMRRGQAENGVGGIHEGKSAGRAFRWQREKDGSRGVRSIMQACHAVIHAAERSGQPDLAHGTLINMHKAGMQPDTAIYNSVLRLVAAEGGDPDALEEVVADMVAHGAAPDRRSYFLLLRGHTRAGDLFGAKRVMQRMATDGIAPDRFTYNALLEVHAAGGDLDGASKLYDAMLARKVKPDICTFILLFQAIKAYGPIERPLSEPVDQQQGARQSWLSHIRGLGRANAADLLNAWLDDFDAAGLTHEPSSFTALVQALGHTCLIDPMLELVRAAWTSEHLPRPGLYACNAAIAACARVGRLTEAMALYREMEQQGLQADMHTFTPLIAGCAYTRQTDTAYQLFGEMKRRGLQPNTYTYNALIKAECHVGNIQKAMQLVDVMSEVGVSHDDVTWHTLLSAAKHLGSPDVAEMVLERMAGHTDGWTAREVIYPEPVHLSSDQDDLPAAEGLSEIPPEQGWGEQPKSGWDDDDDDDMFGGPRF